MNRLAALLGLLVVVGCGAGETIFGPTPVSTPVEQFPAWRMDRTDAVNWLVGHQPEGTAVWGGHMMAAVLEGNANSGRIVFVKIPGVNYEVLEYDAAFIYHREDHGGRWNGGATWGLAEPHAAYSWRNVDGTKTVWMPRRVTPGFYYANEASKYHYGLGDCRIDRVFRSNLYAHVVGVEKVDVGGQVGITEALHTFFEHPKDSRKPGFDTSEHYWYSWEYGWVKWNDAASYSVFNAPRPATVTYEEPCIDTEHGK